MQNLQEIKQEMCDVGYRIWHRGYCAGNEGNHSVRISDDRVLTTPTGLSKGFLKPEMITMVDMDGVQIDKNNKFKRSSEVLMHLAIYKARADIRAVVHSHPPHATAFAITNVAIPEGIHPEAEVFLGRIPMAEYATPSKPVLGQSVVGLIGPHTNTVIMGNHGTVSFDTTLIGAYYKLEILDAYCRLLILSKSLGKANVLNPSQMHELLEVKQKFGIPDERIACSAQGCVGAEQNQDFFATFEQTVTAICADQPGGQNASTAVGPEKFEQMVQAITDQIMAGIRS